MINRRNLLNKKFSRTWQFCIVFSGILLMAGFSGCNFGNSDEENNVVWDTLVVTASAYNSLSSQTGPGDPNVTAWGDTLEPGMKVIAVSRDLIRKGLDYNTPVKIEGFDGVFVVKDKMHRRWNNKIDIYMGKNVQMAKKWGRKKVEILYLSPQEPAEKENN